MGGGYAGWQRQERRIHATDAVQGCPRQLPNQSPSEGNPALGIQQVLEEALSRLSPTPVRVTGAGRTDKGVHALGQVASFQLEKEWAPERLRLAVNFHLPEDVRVVKVFPVAADFDARRSALWREYRYFVWHGWVCPPHLSGRVWWRKSDWDMEAARRACRLLEGEHDFRAFCRTGECPERSVRTLNRVRLQRWGAMSVLTVRAPSFLMNMVRILVGNVDAVARTHWSSPGGKRRPLSWLEGLLNGGERSDSAMTVPACGLWFWRAAYRELPEMKVPLGMEF